MRATLIHGPRDIRVADVPDPVIHKPTDAVVRVLASCVCGSDLHPYRGTVGGNIEPRRIGHEFVGLVEDVGDEVSTVRRGQFVIAPFVVSDGTCANCANGITTSCLQGASWGGEDADGFMVDGGQGEFVWVPWADGTLVATTEVPDDSLIAGLLALSDVMCTGHHAAISAGVGKGKTVVVVGDGAVGLSAVLASHRLGAERVVAMSRHASRQAVASEFGATHIVAERGDEGVAAIKELFDGIGADCVLECVGTAESMQQAIESTRPGGRVGCVGVPVGAQIPIRKLFGSNIAVAGGIAPARSYIDALLGDVLDRRIEPGKVFDSVMPLEETPAAYKAMDERMAIKVLLRP